MKRILLFGAGRYAIFLFDYLKSLLKENSWELIVCNIDDELITMQPDISENIKLVSININDDAERKKLIQTCDIVISFLSVQFDFLIAQNCIEYEKSFLSTSSPDENIRSLENDIKQKKILFLFDMHSVIEHMIAMKLINSVKNKNASVTSFISYNGNLISPENDNNPWHYKIISNARNLVLAGKDGGEHLKNDKIIKLPYHSVFRNCLPVILPNIYPLCWYADKNSLEYSNIYELQSASTFARTTLRHPAFCRGWNKFINIGLTATDDFESIKNCKTLSDWLSIKTAPYFTNKDWNNYLQLYLTDPFKNEFDRQIVFLGLRSKELLPENFKCSADILQYVLEKKLAMSEEDKDITVLLHEIKYSLNDQLSTVNSSLIVKGDDKLRSAMAKTLGLPIGIVTKLILQGKLKFAGLCYPVISEIYEPVLEELEGLGIKPVEETLTQ